MWIALNPQKAHRFTTKGINLHKGAPVAYVDPGLESEFLEHIKRAINDGKLIEIESNTLTGLTINKQASLESISQEDTEKTIKVESVKDEEGNIITNILKMPDDEGQISENKDAPRVIMTGIQELPLEDGES